MRPSSVESPRRAPSAGSGIVRLLNASVLSLFAVLVLWETVLAPIRTGGSFLALKALPLAIALPGLFRGARYTRQWMSLLLPFYAAEGIIRAFSESGRVRVLASVELALATLAFVAIVVMLKRR